MTRNNESTMHYNYTLDMLDRLSDEKLRLVYYFACSLLQKERSVYDKDVYYSKIIDMLDDADAGNIRLIYHFVRGLLK